MIPDTDRLSERIRGGKFVGCAGAQQTGCFQNVLQGKEAGWHEGYDQILSYLIVSSLYRSIDWANDESYALSLAGDR